MKTCELYKKLDEIIPSSLCCEWDNDGLSVLPSPGHESKRILIALDVRNEVIDYAEKNGFDTIVTHHPLIFSPLKELCGETVVSKKALRLIRANIAAVSFHTRFDALDGGVSDILFKTLGFLPFEKFGEGGCARLCNIGERSFDELAAHVKEIFGPAHFFAEKAKQDGRTPIAMMHHSLLPHYELQPMIRRWRYYAKWFADNGVQTVLTGHIHANDVASAVSDRGNTVYDVQTGALIASPNTYRILTCTDDGIQIDSRFITKIDGSLLPDYLTPEQKTLIEADFPAYARRYFENGVCKWMTRNLGSVNRLARWFKLKEGTKAYDAAARLMQRIGAAVGQDIYGETNSIEAALAPYGVSVPTSGYRKPYQAAATIMYGFFHGDEETISSEADVKMLLTCLEGAVLTAVQSGIGDETLRELVLTLTGSTARVPSSALLRHAAEKIALALLQTLAGGFTDDYSAPSDLSVTLSVHTAGRTAPLHIAVRLWNLFLEFWKRVFSA